MSTVTHEKWAGETKVEAVIVVVAVTRTNVQRPVIQNNQGELVSENAITHLCLILNLTNRSAAVMHPYGVLRCHHGAHFKQSHY